ncbi:MAG TPA: hypothetical protein VHR18_03275 [Solirubrobacterales bacterium]|jgi:hypothetical protein|nr:hypothetical protein [Solirubrobacterales bacterium]
MPEAGLHKLLVHLGIKRVLVVDDQFIPPGAVYTLQYEVGEGPELEALPPLPDGADYEQHIENHWPDVPIEEKVKVRKNLLKRDNLADPTGDPTRVSSHIGNLYFRGMTLHEWEVEKERLLDNHQRALVLFDVNFGDETRKDNDRSGLRLAKAALEQTGDHVVGLLTTEAPEGKEAATADKWAGQGDIERAGLVVINKRLLSGEDAKDLPELVEQVRAVLLASQIGTLRREVQDGLEEAMKHAAASIGDETPQVLEDLVFRSSREGGEWEGDTWFRLFKTLGIKKARERLATDKVVRRGIEDVRNLLHARPADAHEASEALAFRVEKAEAYDDAAYVNGAGLPIANGDLFQTQHGKVFILVGQPCDLALRPEGRAYDPSAAFLLAVREVVEEGTKDGTSRYLLPRGGPTGDGEWAVRFRPEYQAAFDVLDLVSFNTEGKATIAPHARIKLEPLLPGLQRRLEQIENAAEKVGVLLKLIDEAELGEVIKKKAGNDLRHKILDEGGPFKATLGSSPTRFAFHCKRIGRLTGTYADALLVAHASARSRTAHAHELTRIVADDRPSGKTTE